MSKAPSGGLSRAMGPTSRTQQSHCQSLVVRGSWLSPVPARVCSLGALSGFCRVCKGAPCSPSCFWSRATSWGLSMARMLFYDVISCVLSHTQGEHALKMLCWLGSLKGKISNLSARSGLCSPTSRGVLGGIPPAPGVLGSLITQHSDTSPTLGFGDLSLSGGLSHYLNPRSAVLCGSHC